jgi:hypothetical protein
MTHDNQALKDRFNNLLSQLEGIPPELLAKYRYNYSIGTCKDVEEEYFILLQALINLKKLLPADVNTIMYAQINEFLTKSIVLSQEITHPNMNWDICKKDRIKEVNNIICKYEEVVQAINTNSPDLPAKSSALITDADKMRNTFIRHNRSVATLLTIGIIGSAIMLAGIAVACATIISMPLLFAAGIMSATLLFYLPAINIIGLAVGATILYLGVLTGVPGFSGISPRIKTDNVADAAKKITTTQQGFFAEKSPKTQLSASETTNKSTQLNFSGSSYI